MVVAGGNRGLNFLRTVQALAEAARDKQQQELEAEDVRALHSADDGATAAAASNPRERLLQVTQR